MSDYFYKLSFLIKLKKGVILLLLAKFVAILNWAISFFSIRNYVDKLLVINFLPHLTFEIITCVFIFNTLSSIQKQIDDPNEENSKKLINSIANLFLCIGTVILLSIILNGIINPILLRFL